MNVKFSMIAGLMLLVLACDSGDSEGEDMLAEIGVPAQVQLFDINNRGNASDIRVFFSFFSGIENVREFRLIVIPDGSQPQVSLADFPTSGNSVQVLSPQRGQIRLNLDESLRDYEGNQVVNGTNYAVGIAAIHQDDSGTSQFHVSETTVELTAIELHDLYISNNQNNSVVIIDEVTGEFLGDFINPGSGGLGQTQEMIINGEGNFIVSGVASPFLLLFDTEGNFIRNFSSGYTLGGPTKMELGPDNLLYVSQWTNNINNIARFEYETGAFVDEFVTGIDRAMGHAWDSEGNYYLASFGSGQVTKYDSDGNLLSTIGASTLAGPVDLWIDEGRNGIFVLDWSSGRVSIFNLETLAFERHFISGMQSVEGALFGRDNALYLCDWNANSVNEYDLESGALRRSMQFSELNSPNDVIYGPNVDPR